MLKILIAFILIAAAAADLLPRIGLFPMPEQFQFYPGQVVLFVGLGVLISGIVSLAPKVRGRRKAGEAYTKTDYDNEINRILEEQRSMSQKNKKTVNSDAVIYDEDAI